MKEDEIEEEKEEDVVVDQEKKQKEVEEEADEGKTLVISRVLSGQKGAKDEQRENIFHSKCTV